MTLAKLMAHFYNAAASIDADNEKYIQEAISELCKGKTLLVIAFLNSHICQFPFCVIMARHEIRKENAEHEYGTDRPDSAGGRKSGI